MPARGKLTRMTRGLLVFSIAHIRQPLLLDYETHTGNHYSVSYSSLLLPLRWRSCPRHRTDKKCGRIHSCLPSRAQPNCFCGMGSCLKCTVMIVVDPAGARRRQARKAQPGGRVPCGGRAAYRAGHGLGAQPWTWSPADPCNGFVSSIAKPGTPPPHTVRLRGSRLPSLFFSASARCILEVQ